MNISLSSIFHKTASFQVMPENVKNQSWVKKTVW